MELLGETPVHVTVEGGEMLAYGPWRLTIHGVDRAPGRRVLATWSMRWLRASTPLIERWGHVFVGGQGSSTAPHDVLERGASELWLGASERMWLGASEWHAAGASEALWLGASLLGGASPLGGTSERHAASHGERWGGR
ncbi:MAG TPA: hypothetical protein VIJ22_03675 [Polyangiaceae bacterium]